MFPLETIESESLESLLFYSACLGILLLIGIVIRIKLKIFKKFIIPASLIAGVIGLLIGPHVLGFLPVEMMDTWSAYASILIAIVFAPMLIGININFKRIKETQAIPQFIYSWNMSFMQWGIPLIIMALFLTPFFGVNPLFGTLTEVGWHGGHGTAGGMSEVYENFNWSEGVSLGLTVATIGLVFGVIGGTIIINYGVRKGYTNYMGKDDTVVESSKPDIIPRSEQQSSSVKTIQGEIVEGYGFHLAIISVAIFIGWILQNVIEPYVPGVPLFPLTMIGGLIVGSILKRTSLYEAVDLETFRRIQGLAIDFLIVSAVASISLPVVFDHLVPLIVMSIVILFLMVFFFFYIGPRLFEKDWFEHSIINLGAGFGVAAVGYMLLRMVDPKLQSDAFIAYGLRAPLVSPFAGGGLATASIPILTISFGALPVGLVCIGLMIVIFIIAKVSGLYGRHSNNYFNHSLSVSKDRRSI
ncbi:sodium/glutamate symporter [Natribacillus halophilus]|uniref:Glutamate:Na+ symporter, ESS family n=1 Tax=Natribacillus halophilus TaxID=549003 RepID=A0A1G8P3N0_9BACI|nr:sodium/glutamate symporter [Natribacillus halophilus]SDI86898.1 glutamate:Na+ symporter, ESS family [Natribacillus halophilus]